jgi:hypothetical protein
LKDVSELPSMEEFEKLVAESFQSDLLPVENSAESESASAEAVAEEMETDPNEEPGDQPEESVQASGNAAVIENEPEQPEEAVVSESQNPGENDPAA